MENTESIIMTVETVATVNKLQSTKRIIIDKLLSGSAVIKELKKSEHYDTVINAITAQAIVCRFLNKPENAETVIKNFDTLSESQFVKWIDTQLPVTKQSTINGFTIFDNLIYVVQKRKLIES